MLQNLVPQSCRRGQVHLPDLTRNSDQRVVASSNQIVKISNMIDTRGGPFNV